MNESKNILLIGLHNSGKSHFGAQFELRLSLSKGQLQKYIVETDTSLFQGVKERLVQGLTASHTPTGTKKSKQLLLINDKGERLNLAWQDYAGEQIGDFVESRKIPDTWYKDVVVSDSWLLFIRTADIKVKKDPINQSPNDVHFAKSNEAEGDDYEYADQTRFVELLQMMLFSKGARQNQLISEPRLTVVLTCWDEIDLLECEAGVNWTPREVLRQHAPMLHDFVCNTWDGTALNFVGLSSLGMALSDDEPNQTFLNIGPENAGWIILPDGSRTSDLTIPVAMSL